MQRIVNHPDRMLPIWDIAVKKRMDSPQNRIDSVIDQAREGKDLERKLSVYQRRRAEIVTDVHHTANKICTMYDNQTFNINDELGHTGPTMSEIQCYFAQAIVFDGNSTSDKIKKWENEFRTECADTACYALHQQLARNTDNPLITQLPYDVQDYFWTEYAPKFNVYVDFCQTQHQEAQDNLDALIGSYFSLPEAYLALIQLEQRTQHAQAHAVDLNSVLNDNPAIECYETEKAERDFYNSIKTRVATNAPYLECVPPRYHDDLITAVFEFYNLNESLEDHKFKDLIDYLALTLQGYDLANLRKDLDISAAIKTNNEQCMSYTSYILRDWYHEDAALTTSCDSLCRIIQNIPLTISSSAKFSARQQLLLVLSSFANRIQPNDRERFINFTRTYNL